MLLCHSPWAVTFTNIPLLPSSLRWFRKAEGPGVGEVLLSSLSTGRHWPLSWRVPWVYLTMADFLRLPAKANREHSRLGFLVGNLVGFLQIKPLKMCGHPKLRPPGILLHRVQMKSPVIQLPLQCTRPYKEGLLAPVPGKHVVTVTLDLPAL